MSRVRSTGSMVLIGLLLAACAGRTPAPPAAQVDVAAPVAPVVMDETALGEIDAAVEESFPHVRSLLVAVGDETVVDRHYRDGGPDVYGNVYSVTKSVMSTLIGIALEEGVLADLDQTLGALLADHITPRTDPVLSAVTLEQVLTMTAGLPDGMRAQEYLPRVADPAYPANVLEDGLARRPGLRFAYSNLGSDLLSVILTDAAGRPVLDYARENLFDPLGIPTDESTPIVVEPDALEEAGAAHDAAGFTWPRTTSGYHSGAAYLKLTPADMLKLGQLYLREGRWGDRQVVPAWYVRRATRPADVPGASRSYGYHWWLDEVDGHDSFAAYGHGGQLIEVVPELDLVVVVVTAPVDGDDFDGHDAEGFRRLVLERLVASL
jgi:CubicO group peptidase (beta-lactamase class C family)